MLISKLDKLILDMDSSVSETYGNQQGSAYNGHFGCTCYHPLFLFNQFGDLEAAMLRRGNHPSAKFWRRVLQPVVQRYRDRDIPKYFRGDSAFAKPELYRYPEAEDFGYVIRLKSNPVLQGKIAHLMTRPVGRPPLKPKVFYHSFLRHLALPKPVRHWSLTTLREKLIKIGAKVVQRSRYLTLQLAEVAVPRKLFALILNRICGLRPSLASG